MTHEDPPMARAMIWNIYNDSRKVFWKIDDSKMYTPLIKRSGKQSSAQLPKCIKTSNTWMIPEFLGVETMSILRLGVRQIQLNHFFHRYLVN